MSDGLNLAKVHLKTIFAQVQTFLDMHQVVSAGPFLYAFVQEVSLCRKLPLLCMWRGRCYWGLPLFRENLETWMS